MLMRLERAERLGLTYEEYTLEILERAATSEKGTPKGLPKSAAHGNEGGSAIWRDTGLRRVAEIHV